MFRKYFEYFLSISDDAMRLFIDLYNDDVLPDDACTALEAIEALADD